MFTFCNGDLPGAGKLFEEAIAIDAES